MQIKIIDLIRKGEKGNVEFKEFLTRQYHLKSKKAKLACQMKYRLIMGNGKAIYIIGVKDNGEIRGVDKQEYEETIEVLKEVAKDVGAKIIKEDFYNLKNGKFVAKIVIEQIGEDKKEHLVIGVAGHVDHGKSTLIGCLISGKLDDGSGKTRLYLDVLKHEIERGLSADISFGVYGFSRDGKVIVANNPLKKEEIIEVIEKSHKIITFVDTVGHEPWLRTTIRGIIGQELDYGMIIVAADDGVTRATKEHLAIMLTKDIPIIVVITKIDKVSKEKLKKVEDQISSTLKLVGKIPFKILSEKDISLVLDKLEFVVPILRVSCVSGEGLDLVNKLLFMLPTKKRHEDKPFLMYIDKVYKVPGVGTVISGSVKQGVVRKDQSLLIGPDAQGEFRKVKVLSIEVHHYPINEAKHAIIGIAIKGMKASEIRRGMIACSETLKPKAYKSFIADLLVLSHPTKIAKGYEPVAHIDTIAEAVILEPLDREYLKAGDKGKVKLTFKYNKYYIFEGQKLVIREGRSRGVGKIEKVLA